MPKKRTPLPENIVNAVEKWGLKNCNIDEKAQQIVDLRIARLSSEIRDSWTESEERLRKVGLDPECTVKSYQVSYSGSTHDRQFLPEKDRK
jgi:hypothetical protein